MQNVYQEFYKDRSIYYSTFPIVEQPRQGNWNYQLDDVYTVGILNFAFPEDRKSDNCVYREIKLMDVKSMEVFYDKLTYLYVELANFHRSLDECMSILDKWIYCLKNLSNLMSRPAELQERVFARLFKTAEISQLNSEDRRAYELSVNAYRDIKNGVDAAKKEGREEGRKEEREKNRMEKESSIRKMLKDGISPKQIASWLAVPVEEVIETGKENHNCQ